jgi:dTDP-6-deoxy-L-talose 4-dehydrogenase [NAD(P)+]
MPASAGCAATRNGDSARSALVRAVLIGGTGFIGQHVCTAFRAAGHDLVVVARDPARNKSGLRFVPLDLSRAEAVSALSALIEAERPDVVVNAAGAVWAPTEQELHASNIELVRHVIAALSALPKAPRLIHLGSVNEYAPMPPGVAVDEDTPLRPLTNYGRSKLTGSTAVLRAMEQSSLDGLVLRFSNVAGPGLPPVSLLGRVAEQLEAAARSGDRATVRLHSMRAQRDFVDYKDAAHAILAASKATVSGRVVNIGRGEAVSVRSLVGLLISASGIPADVVVSDRDPSGSGPPAEAEWLRVNPSTAAELLGWSPRRWLADSVRDLWAHVHAGGRAAARPV